ncbi:MAG: hypothetical protein JSW55_15355 [Chloroflexota bacterium]|nr:MAG: hypothetical protein JSW55_15355 [Chloroflexota bacterium]
MGIDEADGDRAILPYNFVTQTLGLKDLLSGQLFCIQVNRARFGAHVKAYGRRPDFLDKSLGQNVLASVLLHMIESGWPVNPSFYALGLQTVGQQVNHCPILVTYSDVLNWDAIDVTDIMPLPA